VLIEAYDTDRWLDRAGSAPGRRLVRGVHNSVVLVPEGPFVLKAYGDRLRADNELAALGALAATGVPAPRVLAYGPADRAALQALGVQHEAATVMVTSWVSGRPLAPSRIGDLVPVLRQLYRVDPRVAGKLAAPEAAGWSAYLRGRLQDYATTLADCAATLGDRTARPAHSSELADWLRSRVPEPPVRSSLLHNDLSLANAMQQGRRVVLLDWEAAVGGDPLLDLARLWFRTPGLSEMAVLDVYRQVSPGPSPLSEAQRRLRFYFGYHLLATEMVASISSQGDLAAVRADVIRGYGTWAGFSGRRQPGAAHRHIVTPPRRRTRATRGVPGR
jgi:aminoglycoside phosphotransferase (APT) family kinase protein